ncbi:MAG TPA: pyridoxamine 5'-phosphate oxidase [Casimicrobiaceae bacterium]|nr:pyridoxamine 5'-phosphate oxidase [Casimicrobiaceae bacterium]
MPEPPVNLAELRTEYKRASLDESDVARDPFVQFAQWFDAARTSAVPEPNAMTLATVDAAGRPAARIVLLKEVDARGFVFYTNYESRKGRELLARRDAALLFFWAELERQVRIEGAVEMVDAATADAYFRTRPRLSRIGAWASPQSEPLPGRAALERSFAEADRRYPGEEVPRPPHWGGYRVVPVSIEFWQGRVSRLHDRIEYRRDGESWRIGRLAP